MLGYPRLLLASFISVSQGYVVQRHAHDLGFTLMFVSYMFINANMFTESVCKFRYLSVFT